MSKNKFHIGSRITLLYILAMALSACSDEITVPDADSTVPITSMSVFGYSDTIVLTSSSTPVSRTAPNRNITILASARDDDGGVKNIIISGEVTRYCVSGDLGSTQYLSYLSQNPDPSASGPGDTAQSLRLTSLEINIDNLISGCPSGFSFSGMSGSFAATGKNFHGGADTTASFSFSYP